MKTGGSKMRVMVAKGRGSSKRSQVLNLMERL